MNDELLKATYIANRLGVTSGRIYQLAERHFAKCPYR